MADITVVGVGNTIMTDDGFGVRAAEALQQMTDYPDFVQILDGGTLGMDLMPYIVGSKKLLFIDAINIDAPAGSYHRFTGDELNAYFKDKLSVHDLGLNDMLAVLKVTGEPVEEVIVIGVTPEIVTMGLDLTEKIAAKVPETAAKAKEIVDKWVAQHKA